MRPLELTLEGFRSHRQRVTLDWRDRRLVGIVGRIGSGKSTILDAIVFALYGKTPVFERDTKNLIHQLCKECHVELVFDVDGEVWRAVRALRSKGQSGHSLDHLASQEPGSESLEPTITGETAVNRQIEQLLGLDFKGFCRSVLLAQNQFSRFLKATRGERNDVLKGVFGLDLIDAARVRAKFRLERLQAELEGLAEKRREIAEAKAELPGAAENEERASTRRRGFEEAAPKVEACIREQDAARREAKQASERIENLRAVKKVLPRRDSIDQAATEADESEKNVKAARALMDKASTLRTKAQAVLGDTRKRTGTRQELARVGTALATLNERVTTADRERQRLTEADERIGEAESQLKLRESELEHAQTVAQASEKAVQAATAETRRLESEIETARHAQYAFELRGELHAGERCPVCEQEVHELPAPVPRSKDLEVADRRHARALGILDKKSLAKEAAGKRVASAEEAVRAARRTVVQSQDSRQKAAAQLKGLEAELLKTKQKVQSVLGKGDLPASLEKREQELDAAEGAVAEAERRERDARDAVDAAQQARSLSKESLASLASTLTGSWGRLGEDRDVPPTPKALRDSLEQLTKELTIRHEEAASVGKKAAANSQQIVHDLNKILDSLGLTADSDFNRERSEVAALHGRAEQRIKQLKSRIRQESKLTKRVSEGETARNLVARLAKDLEPSRFLAFLLEEHRAELAELGSEHFEQLTAGDYRFTADDQFDIVDLNAAGAVRRADSLSGGETFLASLALALGLAEIVARGGGRLDSFFLDEGFGSLDPEHLDLAMDGIGRLVVENDRRLVVLVSHVPEMSEAIEDLIVLDKDEATGDSRLVSGAVRES